MCNLTTTRVRNQVRDRRPRPQSPGRPAWEWTLRPSPRPMGWHAGILAINGTPYLAECTFEQNDEYGTFCIIDLRRTGGTHYRIVFDPQGTPTCDCPDATYRPEREHCCKHCQAVLAACEDLSRCEPTADDLAEFGEWLAEQQAAADFEAAHGEPVPF